MQADALFLIDRIDIARNLMALPGPSRSSSARKLAASTARGGLSRPPKQMGFSNRVHFRPSTTLDRLDVLLLAFDPV